jgi:ParB family chromosome partitioning protein
MTPQKRGMGRGLAAIISASSDSDAPQQLRELPVEMISPNPRQPRRRFDEDGLQALAGSLGEQGVLQPVLVRPKPGGTYELIAGERRWRAARIAGLENIPALIRQRDDAEALELALIENMARQDLNPAEEARACAALVEELGLTREEVGRRVGRSRVAVSNLLRLLDLPDDVLEMLETGSLSEGHGRALLLAEDHGVRRRLARSAMQDGWSVRVLEARARESGTGEAVVKARKGGSTTRVHPDQEHAARNIGEILEDVLGAEVQVRVGPAGGYRAELSFASPEEALDLARRLKSAS